MERIERFEYALSFSTPAFLGNAEQRAAWRSPPFKALLRHWWRVWRAAGSKVSVAGLREEEGDLFGNAWLNRHLHRASRVRIAVRPPARGGRIWETAQWPERFERVRATATGQGVPSDLYLGYGPITPPGRGQRVNLRGGALAPAQCGTFFLSAPQSAVSDIRGVLQYIDWFGAVGSRARNGWGSVSLSSHQSAPPLRPLAAVEPMLVRCLRPWWECLDSEWPHALGADDKGRPLVWISGPLENWRKAIELLAQIKAEMRIRAKSNPAAGALAYLGYPAGPKGNPCEIPFKRGSEGRLPSQIRFKIRPEGDCGKVVAVIYHLPCAVPEDFIDSVADSQRKRTLADVDAQRDTWKDMHGVLDGRHDLRRLGAH
ncbi:MAG: hypothetical protein GKR94_11350 [Gammaproteobacteria bacterium]|nr:hypothetical protein [Gammaproteobacteria bacterium]